MLGNCKQTSHDSRRPILITGRNKGIASPPPTGTSSPFTTSVIRVPGREDRTSNDRKERPNRQNAYSLANLQHRCQGAGLHFRTRSDEKSPRADARGLFV